MSNVDKTQATINFILTYEGIAQSPIFVNFISAKDNDVQLLTDGNDVSTNRRFIDGSIMKRYTFSIV